MNDDFLYRLRKEPPRAFAERLKARLEHRNPRRARFSIVRTLVLGLLVGGAAVAATWWSVQGDGSGELRAAVSSVLGSNPRASGPLSPETIARQGSFRDGLPLQGSRHAQPTPVASSSAQAPGSDTPKDEPALAEAMQGGVVGGYGGPHRSAQRGAANAAHLRKLLAAGHENGMMLLEAVGKRTGFELELEQVEDDEAFRRLCITEQAHLVVTTRAMTEEEKRQCRATLGSWAYRDILAMKLGYMGVAISAAKFGTSPPLSPREIFLALAKRIPDPEAPARFIPNTNVSWHQVRGDQERRITFFGPERDLPLARVFAAVIMKKGCNTFPSIAALRDADPDEYRRICREIREDFVYTSVREDEFFLTQTLWGDPHAIAVLSLPFFDSHREELSRSLLSGVQPTKETIASGAYEGSITLFLYARGDETAAAWMARDFERAIGPPTHLAGYGLIPLDAREDR